MLRYTYKTKTPSARAAAPGARVSRKTSVLLCRTLNNKPLAKGKRLLEGLAAGTRSIGSTHPFGGKGWSGKFYTNTAQHLLDLLATAEQNAESRGLNPDRLFIKASAHRGFTFMTPRRFKLRGRQRKVANLQVVLEQR